MKVFRCGDVVPGCSATFEAPSESEVVEAAAEHARRDHGQELDGGTLAQVRDQVREA